MFPINIGLNDEQPVAVSLALKRAFVFPHSRTSALAAPVYNYCFLHCCSVVIRGTPSDDAVLCTRDKTFELRVADTSNTLLLAPSLNIPTPQTQGLGMYADCV